MWQLYRESATAFSDTRDFGGPKSLWVVPKTEMYRMMNNMISLVSCYLH